MKRTLQSENVQDDSPAIMYSHDTPVCTLCWSKVDETRLLLLEVVENNGLRLRVDTPVADNDAGAADNFAGFTFLVNLAETGPFTELLVVVHLHQGDVVLAAQGQDQFLVQRLGAVVSQDAEQGLSPDEKNDN